jgi:uncharacterized protein DUF5335
MQTRTISPSQWSKLFDSFSRVYDGSRATLEVISDDLGAQMEVEDQPFRGISADATGIELHFLVREGGHLTHRVPDPTNVLIEEGDDGLVAAIEIQSKNDPTLVLRLQSPVPARLLEAALESEKRPAGDGRAESEAPR